jgi:hypothetical protein
MILRTRPDAEIAAAPGRLLYTTSFDADQQGDWQLEDTAQQAITEDGELRLTVDAENPQTIVMLRRTYADMDVRINVKWLTAPDARGYVGVQFRKSKDSADAGYYEFKLDNRGAYRVELVRAGRTPEVLSDWQIAPFALNGKDQINQLRIVAKVYVFSFYLNDRQLSLCLKGQDAAPKWTGIDTGQCQTDGQRVRNELVEQTLSSGWLGLETFSDESNFSVAFDNMLIYGPR